MLACRSMEGMEFKVTTVNILVVCSSIVAFFNPLKCAFLGVGSDNAVMVVTSDLNEHYHYDPAAQIIIGNRIARALESF